MENLIKKRYEGLVILEIYGTGKRKKCLCKCDCGSLKEIIFENLASGNTKSCGCLRTKKNRENIEKARNAIIYKENTAINLLNKKTYKNNILGEKGITKLKSGMFQAKIYFQKRTYYLGTFETLGLAIEARKKAEKMLHEKFLRKNKKQV